MKNVKLLLGALALIMAMVFSLSACGGGGGSFTGNSISGNLSGSATASNAKFQAIPFATGSTVPLGGYTVQLVDSAGQIFATTQTDSNGYFNFSNVPQGSYTIVVLDPSTRSALTSFDVALVNGDNAVVNGSIGQDTTGWTVDFGANDSLDDAEVDAHAKELADASGKSVDEIMAMRNSGMGWGEIAKLLGVHPKVLGLGDAKDDAFDDHHESANHHGNGHDDKDDSPDVDDPESPDSPDLDTPDSPDNGGGKDHGGKGK